MQCLKLEVKACFMSVAVVYHVLVRCVLKGQKGKNTRHEIGTVRIFAQKLPGLTLPPVPSPVDVIGHNGFFVPIQNHLIVAK